MSSSYLPILTHDNHVAWFLRTKTKIQRENAGYALEHTAEQLQAGSDQAQKYELSNAIAKDIMYSGISQLDLTLLQEKESAKSIWIALREKYNDIRPPTTTQLLRKITLYKTADDVNLKDSWENLKILQAELAQINQAKALNFNHGALFRIFLQGLPSQYNAVADSMMGTDWSIEAKLRTLMNQEDKMKRSNAKTAPAECQNRGRGGQPPQNRYGGSRGAGAPGARPQRSKSPKKGEQTRDGHVKCELCGSTRHVMMRCVYLPYAIDQIASLKNFLKTLNGKGRAWIADSEPDSENEDPEDDTTAAI